MQNIPDCLKGFHRSIGTDHDGFVRFTGSRFWVRVHSNSCVGWVYSMRGGDLKIPFSSEKELEAALSVDSTDFNG